MNEMFKAIFEKFQHAFPPATPEDCTVVLTTDELFKTFARFYPGAFSEDDLFNLLIASGYDYYPLNSSGTISIKWYLKENKL